MKKHLLVLFVLVLMVSGCSVQAAPITGSWKLTAYGPAGSPTPAVTGVDATLTFDSDGNVGGSDGCNSFSGVYEVSGDEITFSQVVATLRACGEPQTAQELVVFQVMSDTATFNIDGNTLTITKGDMVLVFTSAPTE